jgi:transposase
VEHIGIDLGARHSHLVIIGEDGQVAHRSERRTAELPAWLSRRPAGRVVMEACTQSPAIARASQAAGHQTIVVPGTLVKALGVGARGIKTDGRDAEVLARASLRNEELPSVHLRSELARQRRELISARATLVDLRKNIVLSLKSWLRGRLITLKGRSNHRGFIEVFRKAALEHEEGLPEATESLLRTFEHLCTEIEGLDAQIKALVVQDEVCKQLMAIPGVGPQIALAFTTHVDDPQRFATASKLASYLALVPGENTTGGRLRRTGTIKAGPKYLKALLVQGAWSMWRSRPNDPMVIWARRIADKRGRRIAIVALARKLAIVMWSMWKHGTAWEPNRASAARAEQTRPVERPPQGPDGAIATG